MADDQQIQVTITADASDFTAAMQGACSAAQASFAQLKQSSTAASAGVVGTSGKHAGQSGKQAVDEWTKSFSNLHGAFNTSINGMILGTTTLRFLEAGANAVEIGEMGKIDRPLRAVDHRDRDLEVQRRGQQAFLAHGVEDEIGGDGATARVDAKLPGVGASAVEAAGHRPLAAVSRSA